MSHERDRRERGPSTTDEPARRPAAGKAVSTSALRPPVQALGGAIAQPRDGSVHETAARGAEGSGGRLPHFDVIQRAFGHHDLSGVAAHTGGAATEAASDLGANAYTHGNHVVLGGDAGLRTVAHEAAHAVQQRSGMSIAGGVGSAGDAHEAHADAVADRVVAGESAAPLLDSYGGSSSAASASAPVQLEPHESEDAAESASIVRAAAGGDNVFVMRALLRALRQVHAHSGGAAHPVEHVVCVGAGDTFDLMIGRPQLDELEQLLETNIQRIERAVTGGSGGDAAPPAADAFSRAFNGRFASILTALRAAGPASTATATAEPAPAEPATAESAPATPADYSAAELRLLVTAGQRAALTAYFATDPGAIPDRLFTGEHGGFTAQQRIILSGHILANGTYTPGTFAQRMHARMCGHWVEMVNAYAGCSADGGAGVETNFDHAGGVVLGSGAVAGEYSGAREAIPEGERTGHRAYTQIGLPVAEYQERIHPGDWLYLYTATDTAGGNHSVIFVGWDDPAQTDTTNAAGESVSYRDAIIMGQSHPDRGGAQATWRLGSVFENIDGAQVYPVTTVMRHPSDAVPAETPDDVIAHELGLDPNAAAPRTDDAGHVLGIPELGSGPGAAGNFTTIQSVERRMSGRVNLAAVRAEIRRRNTAKIAELAAIEPQAHGSTLTDDQRLLFTATNEREDLETLIRLNERLVGFITGATALRTAEETDRARIDVPREEERARLDAEMNEVHHDLDELEAAIASERELVSYWRARRRLRNPIAAAERVVAGLERRVAATRNPTRRAALEADLAEARVDLDEVRERQRIALEREASAAETEGERRETLTDAAESDDHVMRFADSLNPQQRLARMEARLRTLNSRVSEIEREGGYHMAQRVGGDAFRGRSDGDRERTTGLLRNVHEPIDWEVPELVERGVTGLCEEASARERSEGATTGGSRRGRRGH